MNKIEEDIRNVFEKSAKTAYIPIVQDDQNSSECLSESKFGGKPFISLPHYPWPICKCGKRMRFFLQLNSSTLPAKLSIADIYFNGLLQLFYCTENCDGWEPFSDGHVIRVVKSSDLVNPIVATTDEDDTLLFPCKRITGWNEQIDYISETEMQESDEFSLDINKNNYSFYDKVREDLKNLSGEKLFGWPCWVQGIEYPNCRKCNRTMRYIFQVDSERNIPYCFGDLGVGHISQCETHKDEFAFGWACC